MADLVENPDDRFTLHEAHMYTCSGRNSVSLVMRKPFFCICENKDADQLHSNAQLISALVFATRIEESLFFLDPKFQASIYLLWLHSPVCV